MMIIFFSGIQDMCQHTAGQHMSDDDHFSEGQTVTHGSWWSFFAKRTQNLLICSQNGNLRFLTHNRDLGAIPPPKWSYGRRASFLFPKNTQKTQFGLFFPGCVFWWGVCPTRKGPGPKGPGPGFLAYRLISIRKIWLPMACITLEIIIYLGLLKISFWYYLGNYSLPWC